ncbi:acyl-CoA dehydratase activase-related protein [Feifania hominis]|uniref:2-hydroxyacyl-CoA dehydratase n=1 Tax=Feifania hominis TaxID=2763660 RepID=A0A926HTI3_9FIRM|nr:acyl-CoA dehydratase activase-related protein [Feifania hominis]MBC8535338.1 2-hydroxyacyl-CoA dehydratase [Feifania hominis]
MGLSVGIDVGSTTVKVVVLDDGIVRFWRYERHLSQVRQKTVELLGEARELLEGREFSVAVSGSAGLGMAKAAGLPFIQEVFATAQAVEHSGESVDIVIELGGEDAKIIFLSGGLDERMNGSCAGGTGAFIDQMATLLNVTADELDRLSLEHEKIYPIASRCGVFAKSDIQPLLNQGANKADVAASIFQAVVDQTITGLAQGRELKGRIAFLGGPLYFFEGLRRRFVETLGLAQEQALFPDWGIYAVAIGTALYAQEQGESFACDPLLDKLRASTGQITHRNTLPALFADEAEYEAFLTRHSAAGVATADASTYEGRAYLGVDCGSTTTKVVLLTEDDRILYQYYSSNRGNPVSVIRGQLMQIRELCGERITIAGSVATGYGEDLVKSAFHFDAGVVETMAHFKAARHFCPDVDFILDIGGQDIKCFKIRNNSIDSIMLNEACSSGCGSFVETFASTMGYDIEEFAKLGLLAEHPVDLGSRCTVFMNSSVKQAQKEGATVADISAGLSISVVKNAIYKVIRARSAEELGSRVVVQGGTFYNDAVLRSFERELGLEVTRPAIAGLMGAFGAALYAKELPLRYSTTLGLEELKGFAHTAKATTCGLCTNHCNLTVNTFSDGSHYISGNRCERPLGHRHEKKLPNLYEYKLERIKALRGRPGPRGKIGVPLGLNMFENLPFWHTFLTELGYEVVLSDLSSPALYNSGRRTIPSDTACYPAKLMHGHIENLLDKGIDTIFYPCMSYNFDEGKGDNHYNCPVVAYYPELLRGNIDRLAQVRFLYPYFGLHRPRDFVKRATRYFRELDPTISLPQVRRAADLGYAEYARWHEELCAEGSRAIAAAREAGRPMIVLAGRPYHVDPEINHGIDKLISSFGIAVLTEDSVADLVDPQRVRVLNQWTYHARLYNAAKYCTLQNDTELVQLVSFGCGLDAITTDEVRDILERGGKFYTALKIDEISNLGAARIRIRSLLGAMEERNTRRENEEEQA